MARLNTRRRRQSWLGQGLQNRAGPTSCSTIRPRGGTLHAASASSRPADDGKQFSVADRRFLPCAASPAWKRRTKNQLRRNSRNERVFHLPVASSMSWDGLHARRPLECPGTTAKHNDESSAFTSINTIPVNTPQYDVHLKRGYTGSPTPPYYKLSARLGRSPFRFHSFTLCRCS